MSVIAASSILFGCAVFFGVVMYSLTTRFNEVSDGHGSGKQTSAFRLFMMMIAYVVVSVYEAIVRKIKK